ncbi:MAG TPA: response regulator transcription factor [Kouleothrix sp.]|uniref:response regulator n=1 Tax=Kouleothrix sp. TaxID=2779161 RepID=UPI002BE746F3|nr:response regulator transcription factor [Kouleothrix sp.]HRC74207.1 response regulator transcription factor [Kouleothrix sp.]
MSARILVVDDEPQIGRLLRSSLSARGYEVAIAEDGQRGVELAASWRPDVILLDLGLPRLDGLAVCRQVRGWSQVPIIVLTVRDGEHDKVQALDIGADDYLTKPFGIDELLARIRVALRHAQATSPAEPVLRFGALKIDLAQRRVSLDDREVHLTPKEYDLLCALATQAGKVLTHRMLLRAVWGSAYEHDVATLRVFVTQLRRKIETDSARPSRIVTEPGIGYRFQPDG